MRISSCCKCEGPPSGRQRFGRLQRDAGFTLFEVLIASVVLAVGLGSLFGLLDTSLKGAASTRAREGATNLAREILEDARTIPYAQMSPTSIVGQLQAMRGLATTSSPGWTVLQRGITYTVTARVCYVDDPKDGYGKHVEPSGANPFCADSNVEGTEDATPADLKRISVDVKWAALGRAPDVHQVETLTSAGEAPGLTAYGLHLEEPFASTAPVISEEPVSKTLTFAVSAPTGTTAMRWSLEGIVQSPDPVFKAGTTWTFSWTIPLPGVSDGTYQVSVQAIDATGVTGPPVSISVTLTRGNPTAVTGLRGGFNTINVGGTPEKVVELQWQANTERNVIGYRIYGPSPGEALICPASPSTLSIALSCFDKNPPAPNSANLTYTAVALYRDASGAIRQGPPGAFTVIGGPPAAPNPAQKLELKKNADGSVTLTWEKPSSGPEVVFYRIYRGSQNYTSRYDVTASGTTTTYTDTDAEVTHSYWITAVDANLTESSFLGSVTG
jgi:prepilin-type N-terminal cleavage/methylation domain-containing protein